MKMKVAINGFGRIGKAVLRSFLTNKKLYNFEIVHINSPSISADDVCYSLKYDSVHGKFNKNFFSDQCNNLIIGKTFNNTIDDQVTSNIQQNSNVNQMSQENYIQKNGDHSEQNLNSTDKTEYDKNTKISISSYSSFNEYDTSNFDIILDCSGKFDRKEFISSKSHFLISAPYKNSDYHLIIGLNEKNLSKKHKIISLGSCTTNAIIPVINLLDKKFIIDSGFITTVHSYTNDQVILDKNHHKDRRRGRAAALSMIPTTTGVASMINEIMPHLSGNISASSIRVPVSNVSFVDFVFNTRKKITSDKIHQLFLGDFNDIISSSSEELVSCDFNGSSFSGIVDFTQTFIINDSCGRIGVWYDNEYGFANRMLDACNIIYQLNS